MPDIFVPLDTAGGSNYLYELRYKGIMSEFTLNYMDNNRENLLKQYPDAVQFKNEFIINNDLFNSLIKFASGKEIERNLAEIRTSKKLIERGLKAIISKNLYNDFGYYVIINDYDKTVQTAIKSFE